MLKNLFTIFFRRKSARDGVVPLLLLAVWTSPAFPDALTPSPAAIPVMTVSAGLTPVARQQIHGRLPKDLNKAQFVRDVPESETLKISIELSLRNQKALEAYMDDVENSTRVNPRPTLTDAQFNGVFMPTESDYQALIDFVKEEGLTVTNTSPDRIVLFLSGTVKDIERVFQVRLGYYRGPAGPEFRSPDHEPSIGINVPITSVIGLTDQSPAQPVPSPTAGISTPIAH